MINTLNQVKELNLKYVGDDNNRAVSECGQYSYTPIGFSEFEFFPDIDSNGEYVMIATVEEREHFVDANKMVKNSGDPIARTLYVYPHEEWLERMEKGENVEFDELDYENGILVI